MGKDKFKLKRTMVAEDVVSCLESLLEGFKAGQVVIEGAERTITLKPSAQFITEISAKQKKDKEKLTLKLSWTRIPDPAAEDAVEPGTESAPAGTKN